MGPLPPLFFEPHSAEVSVQVVVCPRVPRYTVTRTLSAYRCACRDVLRAVELSTAHMLSTQPKAAANIKLNTETKVGIDVRAPPAILPTMLSRVGCNPGAVSISQRPTMVSRVAFSGLSVVPRAVIPRTIAK